MPVSAPTQYNYSSLRRLWINAGGNKAWSWVMAAIAMAESHGNPTATHVDSNNSVDRGLWQINSIHGYSPSSSYNPEQNARQAVSIFKSAGPHAWSSFNNGSYKRFLPSGKSTPNIADPIPAGQFGRIDQGVDYVASAPVRALVSGQITDIVPFAQGEGVASQTAIMEKFDAPVTYGNRTYYGGYYAEEKPLVSKGQHVEAGQEIMAAGSDELGFLINQGTQFPQLIGGLGPNTKPSPEGVDYAGMVAGIGGPQPPKGAAPGWESTITKVAHDIANPIGGNPVFGVAQATYDSAGNLIGGGVSSVVGGVGSALFGGIESLVLRGFFILIGIGLIVVGLGLVVWTVMGKVGAPGVVGMAQSQMRIGQAGRRIQATETATASRTELRTRSQTETERAAQVRESQASERLAERQRARELSERRLVVHEQGVARRQPQTRKFMDVKRDDRTAARKKPGRKVSGPPKKK